MVFYEYAKGGPNKSIIHGFLNKNETSLNENIVRLDEEDRYIDWFSIDLNIKEQYEKHTKGKISYTRFLETLNHNLRIIDTLKNGDIIKLEGVKLLDNILYHHAAIIGKMLLLEKCYYWKNAGVFLSG